MSLPPADAFSSGMARVEELIERLEQQPRSETLEQARELLHVVLEVHGIGLQAIVELLRAQAAEAVVHQLARDPRIATLLALHELQADGASEAAAGPGELIPVANLLRSRRAVES